MLANGTLFGIYRPTEHRLHRLGFPASVTLVGGGAMTVATNLFADFPILVEIEDQSGVVIEIEDYAFELDLDLHQHLYRL